MTADVIPFPKEESEPAKKPVTVDDMIARQETERGNQSAAS